MKNKHYPLALAGSLALLAGLTLRGWGADEPKPAAPAAKTEEPAGDPDANDKAPAARGNAATRPATRPGDPALPPEMDVPEIPVPPSPVLSPREEMATFKVAPGYRVELVAAEPLVEDPVAIHFDGAGRLWVCEMRAYMPHLDPGAEELKPLGQVSCLEDTDGDGKFDKKTVFLDGLILPRAATPYRDGVLVAAPPYAWFCRDTDGDGKCDERQLLAADYDNKSNPEHQPNGLMPGLDNWVHNSQWGGRFRYVGDAGAKTRPATTLPAGAVKTDPRWVRAAEPSRGQWGISQDDAGRVYTNGNSDHFRGDNLPTWLLSRNPHYFTAVGVNQKLAENQFVYPARATPGVNRGYQPGALTPEGRLRAFTAACAPFVYRGDLLKDADGRPLAGSGFVCEPSANLVRRNVLTETDGLVTKAANAYDKAEFLTSTDERFRPVFLADGPDGALYVCDLYRGVLQHQRYVTPYLRKQIKSRNLEEGVHYGRICRIVPDAAARPVAAKPKVNLLKAPAAEMVQYLSHPSGWWRDAAQQQIIARGDAAVVPALRDLALRGSTWQSQLHTLYTLEGMGQVNEQTVVTALADPDPQVRIAGLRLAGPFAADGRSPIGTAVLKLATDERPNVRLAFLFAASAMKTPEAQKLVAETFLADAERPFVKDAVLTGLAGRELEFLKAVATDPAWEKQSPGKAALLGGLAACVVREGKPDRVTAALELADAQSGDTAWRQAAMVAGMTAADPRGAPTPVRLAAAPPLVAKLEQSADARTKTNAKALTRLLDWPGKVNEQVAKARPLTADEHASFDRGKVIFQSTCAACHQPDGRGEAGKAPSFRNSPLLLGPEGRPIRIALHGLRGRVTINGETADMEMPTLAALADDQIADALTYVRREWDHAADPVTAAAVAKVRAETVTRGQPWTREEITALRMPGDSPARATTRPARAPARPATRPRA